MCQKKTYSVIKEKKVSPFSDLVYHFQAGKKKKNHSGYFLFTIKQTSIIVHYIFINIELILINYHILIQGISNTTMQFYGRFYLNIS